MYLPVGGTRTGEPPLEVGDRTVIELLVPEGCEEVLLGFVELHLPAIVERHLIPLMV